MDDRELQTLTYLKDIVEAYEEIASIRMRRVKHSVLENRKFLDGVRKIFRQVKYSYKKELRKLGSKKKEHIRDTNGKQVSVFLSANTGLYGSIISDTFNRFVKHVRSTNTDVVLVGRVGRSMYQSLEGQSDFEYFELSDSGIDKGNLKELLDYILQYEKIVAFHGKFKDILVQEPTAISISGDIVDSDSDGSEGIEDIEEGVRYLFEPSLEDVMEYFEKEILAAIFEHSIYESNLSKYASRMINLDRATERINDRIDDVQLDIKKAKHRRQNRKQINLLAGVLRGGSNI